MALGDYFKGPEHKANAARLEADMQALRDKYDDLEAKARAIGLLDLLVVQEQIRAEESRLASVQAQVATTQSELEAALHQLQALQFIQFFLRQRVRETKRDEVSRPLLHPMR